MNMLKYINRNSFSETHGGRPGMLLPLPLVVGVVDLAWAIASNAAGIYQGCAHHHLHACPK